MQQQILVTATSLRPPSHARCSLSTWSKHKPCIAVAAASLCGGSGCERVPQQHGGSHTPGRHRRGHPLGAAAATAQHRPLCCVATTGQAHRYTGRAAVAAQVAADRAVRHPTSAQRARHTTPAGDTISDRLWRLTSTACSAVSSANPSTPHSLDTSKQRGARGQRSPSPLASWGAAVPLTAPGWQHTSSSTCNTAALRDCINPQRRPPPWAAERGEAEAQSRVHCGQLAAATYMCLAVAGALRSDTA